MGNCMATPGPLPPSTPRGQSCRASKGKPAKGSETPSCKDEQAPPTPVKVGSSSRNSRSSSSSSSSSSRGSRRRSRRAGSDDSSTSAESCATALERVKLVNEDEEEATRNAPPPSPLSDEQQRFRDQLDLMRRFYSWREIPMDFFVDSHVTVESYSRKRRTASKQQQQRPKQVQEQHKQPQHKQQEQAGHKQGQQRRSKQERHSTPVRPPAPPARSPVFAQMA